MYLTVLKRAGYEVSNLPQVRIAAAMAFLVWGTVRILLNRRDEGLKLLMQAHRVSTHPLLRAVVEERLTPILENKGDGTYLYIHRDRLATSAIKNTKHEVEKRVIVLKDPRYEGGVPVEKGVLYVMFTATLRALLEVYDRSALLRHYQLVLEPSWAGYCDVDILCLANMVADPIYLCATEKTDFDFIKRLSTNLVPLPFGASNWPDPQVFKPLGLQKKYDAVMVAVWGNYKRHHRLLRAIARLKSSSYRLALVGVPYRSSRRSIEQLVHFFGISAQVDLFENLNQTEVNEILNLSKVNVLLSKKEGSNRSIFEGFFADVPGIVLEDNVGVNKTYINSCTGRLIKDHQLEDALRHFSEGRNLYTPREWALTHISPLVTTQALNAVIKADSLRLGRSWTDDIAVHVNRPELQYLNVADVDKYRSPLRLLD